jgi:hypothetical protein
MLPKRYFVGMVFALIACVYPNIFAGEVSLLPFADALSEGDTDLLYSNYTSKNTPECIRKLALWNYILTHDFHENKKQARAVLTTISQNHPETFYKILKSIHIYRQGHYVNGDYVQCFVSAFQKDDPFILPTLEYRNMLYRALLKKTHADIIAYAQHLSYIDTHIWGPNLRKYFDSLLAEAETNPLVLMALEKFCVQFINYSDLISNKKLGVVFNILVRRRQGRKYDDLTFLLNDMHAKSAFIDYTSFIEKSLMFGESRGLNMYIANLPDKAGLVQNAGPPEIQNEAGSKSDNADP